DVCSSDLRTCDSIALFRLAFATATPHGLTSPHIANSQAHSSKGTLSPLLRRLQRFVCKRFQVLFHSPPGVLFTFPSRYLSAIGLLGVFRLTRWSWQIHTGFLGPRATWDTSRAIGTFRLRGWHPLWRGFQSTSSMFRCHACGTAVPLRSPATPNTQRLPAITRVRFGLFRVRSPLLTESRLFSLPVGTEMFHFPTFPLPALYIQAGVTRSRCHAQRGFPIRKSSDQSSIISSPRLIADLYVLLRLQKPRHSPFALRNLMTKFAQRTSKINFARSMNRH